METVKYICPNCGKLNLIEYGAKLECKDCIHG